jgi:glycerate-2-kinase
MNRREIAQKIFIAGVKSVLPGELIKNLMSLNGQNLSIGDHSINLDHIDNIYVLGAGKASAAMGHYVEGILGDRITGGVIAVKYGHVCKLKKIKVIEAGHPIPDPNSFMASAEIISTARQAGENDLVICLLSGGGSALMTDLPEGLLPEELYIVNNLLFRCGASIHEINCVRKHLSGIKGGQLARIIYPATLITLMISDVPGNPPDVIASGPTVPDTSTFADAMNIIEKYRLTPDLTAGVLKYIKDGIDGFRPDTPKPGDPLFSDVVNIMAGTNLVALEAAGKCAEDSGFNTLIVDRNMHGDVEYVAESIVSKAVELKSNHDVSKPVCLLYGGETTIKITNEGLGGRNQHLALSAAVRLRNHPGITILCAGTDGTDGPTDATGAVVDSETAEQSDSLDPEEYLIGFDSYNFFRKAGGHIKTGPTFTNVMDLVVVLID